MPDDKPKRAFNKTTFEQVVYSRNTDMLEHIVLISVLKSYRFYTSNKVRLCPVLPDNRSFRPDFTRAEFNHIYSFVAQFWETLARNGMPRDMSINADLVDLIFAKKVEQNQMQPEDAHAILNWLKEDLRTIDIDAEIMLTLPQNPMFCRWLEERAIDYENRRLSQGLGRAPTLADMQESVRNVQKSAMPAIPRIIETKNILFTKVKYRAPIPLRMPRLNLMMGGGLWHQEALVASAISGGGKTVLAMQWALDCILSDHKTIVLTTEQTPPQLIYRMIANHLNLDFGVFTQRLTVAEQEVQTIAGVEIDYLPPICLSSGYWDAMHDLAVKCEQNLLFIDWTGSGKSFERDFDNDIEEVKTLRPDFEPEVIIADWIGGGLQLAGNEGDKLRHYYRAAGETIVEHMKRTGRAGVMFAQLNKTLVKATQNYVTMDMLAECKSLMDKASGFLGITALRDSGRGDSDEALQRLRPLQFLCADKSRYGTGGKIKVTVEFQHQRFGVPAAHLRGSGAE